MRVPLSAAIFVGLIIGLSAVPFPDDCYDLDPDAVECPDYSIGDYFPIPDKCGLYMICRAGCPEVRECVGCKPFFADTKQCGGRDAKSCDECAR